MYGIKDIGAEVLGLNRNSGQLRKKEFWALHNISFSIDAGESVGLVGSNGAGKSTLLRILSGLIKPDAGMVKIKGRVAPLIALGAGFNPVLTGRENIFVNMAILGLTRSEIKRNFDAVVDFAELGHALDMPVQSYSSGMAARLGFACAIFTNPDILLIDEVLAVGDIKFRVKCYRKLAELRSKNTSFILVSHSAQSILSVCDSAVYLSKGRLVMQGKAAEVTSQYENELLNRGTNDKTVSSHLILPEKEAHQSNGVDFVDIGLCDADGNAMEYMVAGSFAALVIKLRVHKPVDNLGIKIIIRELSFEGFTTVTLDSFEDNFFFDGRPGYVQIKIALPYLSFKPGLYTAKMNVNRERIDMFDSIESFKFSVKDEKFIMLNSTHFQQRSWEVMN